MGRKYRAYPTEGQEPILTGWGHTGRALWNVALEQRVYLWEQRRYTLRSVEQCRHLTAARADMDWMGDLPAQAGQQILRRLDTAYDNFWNPEHPAKFPARKKRGHRLSIPFPGQAVEVRKLNRKWAEVRLPKLGWLRLRLSRALGGTIRNATVSRDGNGWHISFGVHTGARPAPPNGKPGCGVDFGVAASAYVSTENTPRLMPPSLGNNEKARLRHLEQRKARQVTYAKKHNNGRYGNRLGKTTAGIGRLKTRQANRRHDFTHQLTTDLAKNHGMVGIEDLRVKNMTASAKGSAEKPGKNVRQKAGLNRSILDNTPGERRRQLVYKARMHGSELRVVPPFHTSQTCAACGQVDPESRKGCGRLFACVHCGHEDDADHNASVEIEARARRAGGTVINSTRSVPKARVPATGRRRMRETPKPAHELKGIALIYGGEGGQMVDCNQSETKWAAYRYTADNSQWWAAHGDGDPRDLAARLEVADGKDYAAVQQIDDRTAGFEQLAGIDWNNVPVAIGDHHVSRLLAFKVRDFKDYNQPKHTHLRSIVEGWLTRYSAAHAYQPEN